MVEDRRHARNATLRDWIDQGARCPFCGSLRLDVDPTSETPKPEFSGSLPAFGTNKPETQTGRNVPNNFMRVNCENCGYILFFEPSKFGSPGR